MSKHSEMAWTRIALIAAALCAGEAAATVNEQIVSTFIYTMYGDRTPFVLPKNPTLTPLGAQQLYQAGANMRERYLTPSVDSSDTDESTTIRNISPYQIYNEEISVSSTDDQWVVASTQAFLQGLYPPLASWSNYTYISGQSSLANGTNVVAPLDGYQYATIKTSGATDMDSIYLDGSGSCPMYSQATSQYYSTVFYQELQSDTYEFYKSLESDYLSGVFSDASVGFYNAYFIADYLDYEYIHNSTVANNLDEALLTRANILAADWAFAMSANTSLSGSESGDQIGVIAGKTLAYKILESFYATINTQGVSNKLTLAFGSYEPMIAFAALSELISPSNAQFYNLPQPGASFVFELLSYETDGNTTSYPSVNDLFVRFLYRNGTGNDSSLVSYSLFGYSPSNDVMSLTDFLASMKAIAISSVQDWCDRCDSVSIFCDAFTADSSSSSGSTSSTSTSNHSGLHPVAAGVIGAAVTLAFVCLTLAALMLLGGFRLHRRQGKRRSELGGFKGGEKLASDQDLTLPKGGAGGVVTDAAEGGTATGASTGHPQGHERVGSWELKDHNKTLEAQGSASEGQTAASKRPSFEDDDAQEVNPYGAAIKPHESV